MFNLTSVLQLLAGLGIFIFGVESLSTALKTLSLDRLKELLRRFTSTSIKGLTTGIVMTSLLDSSSVVIILLISFVDSQMITFQNSVAVMLGANIGTTLSSQMIAFQIGEYSAIGLVLGAIGTIFFKEKRYKLLCHCLTGLSMIFYGLYLMEVAVIPYKDSPFIQHWIVNLESPLIGILVGGIITLVIQSSSATVGLVIALASQGLIPLESGISVMLGAEIGTCTDALIASIGRSKEALLLGLTHLFFNIASVLLGGLFLYPLRNAAVWLAPTASIGRHIANAHLIFNVVSVLIAMVALALFMKFNRKIIQLRNNTR